MTDVIYIPDPLVVTAAIADSTRMDSIVTLETLQHSAEANLWRSQLADACDHCTDAGTNDGVTTYEFWGPAWRVHLLVRSL